MAKKRLIVIGAGYAGLRAIELLASVRELEILLFDENPYHYLQTEAYGYIAGRFDLHEVALNLLNWCEGFKRAVTFKQERITQMAFERNEVSSDHATYAYDYLIIATGARTNFFSFIQGLREHAHGVKKLDRAFKFRNDFEALLYDKICKKRSSGTALNLAIGGAGLSGVEIAAEMADVITLYTKSIGVNAQELRIHLIDASDTILPGQSRYVIEQTQKRLLQLGVTVMTNAFIERVDATHIHFKSGSALPYAFLIFTGGITANAIPSDAELASNRLNQYEPDSTLRLAPNVFSIGDCAQLTSKTGGVLPPTAQTAESSATFAAKSIRRLLKARPLVPYSATVDGVFVALGGHYAVGELFGRIHVKGHVAY